MTIFKAKEKVEGLVVENLPIDRIYPGANQPRRVFDEHELKHIDNVEMSYHTIKLIFTEGLCENLLRTFPESHKKMLIDAIEGIKKDSQML